MSVSGEHVKILYDS